MGAVPYVPPIFAIGFGIFIFACILSILNAFTWRRDRAEIKNSRLIEGEEKINVDNEKKDTKLIEEVITNQEVDLRDYITLNFRVRNKTFINCTIKGPCVIYLVRTSLIECGFMGTQETIFIPLEENRYVTGLIMIKDSLFKGCTFQNVAIAAVESVRLIYDK